MLIEQTVTASRGEIVRAALDTPDNYEWCDRFTPAGVERLDIESATTDPSHLVTQYFVLRADQPGTYDLQMWLIPVSGWDWSTEPDTTALVHLEVT